MPSIDTPRNSEGKIKALSQTTEVSGVLSEQFQWPSATVLVSILIALAAISHAPQKSITIALRSATISIKVAFP